eukprot:s2383_g2.t1
MSATLDSEAAFIDRAEQMGVERWIINKFKAKKFATFGKLAFAFAYAPQNADDTPLKNFLAVLLEEPPSEDQLATLRRLFFEAHTMALTDVRHRAESTPDPSQATRKMPTAERVARQSAQEKRLGGIIFNPNTIPSNHLVDLFVEMVENGILTYVKPEACCSRAQEVELVRKDTTVSTDATGLLKLGTKMSDPSCEANTEMKLRAAWQRRSLAMDLAGLASFDVMESWVQFLFQQLLRDQPRGFSKISLQQILDCDRNLFVQASHKTMGKLAAGPDEDKPLDDVLDKLKDSNEILQYLAPLPASRAHEAPSQPANPKGPKAPKVDKGGKGPGKGQPSNPSQKPQLPEGCVTHDSENKPLCFAFQNGRCKFKGPPGKRWALSRAAIQAGFSVLSVDHDATHAQVPMVTLDLTTDSGVAILWDILSSPNVAAIHLGLPCGTASLARERPVAASLRALGVPNPPPLRSAQHPLGMPHLSAYNRAKVESANKLYSLALSILLFCSRRNIIVSIENPARSWLWAALVQLSIDMPTEVASCLNALEKVTTYALNFVLKYPPHVVLLERRKNLLQAKLKAIQLEKDEKQLHEQLPDSLKKVLQGKKLLLWRALLEKYGYDDLEVFKFMSEWVHLSGKHDTPACYPEKIRPATLTQEDLERSAVWRRKALLGKRAQMVDPEHVAHLETTAAEELEAGFLEGPFSSEAEDIDYIAGLVLRIAETVSSGGQKFGSGKWLGKCLDLSKAYEQMGIAPAQRHLAVIFFHGQDGNPRFYVANSIMFGATAAVYSFNRVSRSLWFLLNRMLAIPSGVFYDDFPLFNPAELACSADESASELLDLLGWKHARTGPKGKPFESSFQVLGCSLNLEAIDEGKVILENKPGQIDRLLEQLNKMKQANRMSLHEAQVLHGLTLCLWFSGWPKFAPSAH